MSDRVWSVKFKLLEVLKALEVCSTVTNQNSEWVCGLINELEDLLLEDDEEGGVMLERKTVSQCPTSDYCKGWNDAVDAMPKWISVEEKLPEERGTYLTVVRCLKGTWVEINNYDHLEERWEHDIVEYSEDVTEFVTHWMPLPEPPEEEV